MNYQSNESALAQLFQKLRVIPGTLPPVYILNDVLIGYDRLENVRIIAGPEKITQAQSRYHNLPKAETGER